MQRRRTSVLVVVLLLLAFPTSQCYHDADNFEYDCWPLDADRDNTRTIPCGGLAMEWIIEPPNVVERGQQFNVSYRATVINEQFYTMQTVYSETILNLAAVNQTFGEDELRQLCNSTVCPATTQANRTNCCIWHANVHTCHPNVLEEREICGPAICGPWVGNDGLLSTHTSAQVGNVRSVFFAEGVQIDYEGLNFIIAHLRVGDIQIAIGKNIEVILPRVCGDDLCTAEIGEDCSVCPRDCCPSQGRISSGGIAAIVIIGFLVLLAVMAFAVIAGFYYCQHRRQLLDESWIINYEDIEKDTNFRGLAGSMVSLKKLRYLNTEADSSREGHESLTLGSMKKAQIFTQTGRYEGKVVAIKKVPKNDFVLSKQVRKEVHQIRKLDHPNLCKFIGATVKESANFSIISEYCPKGSLNDVLQNDDLPLNWGFRFSFAQDIARGMAYLHSRKLYHGRLTSSNCTIDDRWVVKIADYGVPTLRCVQEKTKRPSEAGLVDCRGGRGGRTLKIYMPPEVKGSFNSSPPTPTTDVYSFAVVLVEIGTRIDTFSEDVLLDSNHRPKVRLSDLNDGSADPCPCPQEYMELIQQCWMFLPSSRPTFDQIKKTIYRINPSKQNPVDNMMFMMEKYSKNLEQLVAERTQELIAEQNKTAQLLHRMLPKSVADDLKQGKPAPAAGFKSATIFFSDIIGFTSLASTSTPMQIVKLLNDLYSTFDDIIDHYDVYKVETIGDAYMVVSGVPNENGNQHAGEIASMGLEFMQACRNFKIPHRTRTKLEIRAGIHSGPVCAGVVGVKMPRYCLFGDTVNTASRMETTSEPMKIQCSDTTYQLLKNKGWFHLESRGTISVKGKGEMTTWWLVGKDTDAERYRTVLDHSAMKQHSPKKQMPAIMQLKDSSLTNVKKYSMESNSSTTGHTTSLPGSVVVEELI